MKWMGIFVIFSSVFFNIASAAAATGSTEASKTVQPPAASIAKMKELSPSFGKLTEEVLFKDIWNRPGLSARDKSLITISVLLATGRNDQAESHIQLGLENGLTENEIESAMTQIAFYAGWPSAVVGLQKLKFVKERRKETK